MNHMELDEKLEENAIPNEITIDYIWDTFIRPLEGQSFVNTQGFGNKVIQVTDAYILKESAK